MARARFCDVRVVIFDLDGTLFDSVGLWEQIDVEFLKARGHVPTEDYHRGIAALGNREVAEFTVKYYGLDDTPEALSAEWADMARAAYANNIGLIDGAREYIDELYSAGVRIVAATSLAGELARLGLESNGIARYFERLFTADEMGVGKNSAAFYSRIAADLGVEPNECMVIDDVALAVKSAAEAGMRAVEFRHEKSYGGGSDSRGDGAIIITSFADAPTSE